MGATELGEAATLCLYPNRWGRQLHLRLDGPQQHQVGSRMYLKMTVVAAEEESVWIEERMREINLHCDSVTVQDKVPEEQPVLK